MSLFEIKEQIVTILHDCFKAYELPKICERLGLKAGDVSEAMNSKYAYVRTRLSDKTKNEVLAILPLIRELTGEELLPEKRYKYIITNVTKRDVSKVLIDGIVDQSDVLGICPIHRIRWNGEIEEIEFIKRICDIDSITVKDTRCKSFEEEYQLHRVLNDDWADNYFFTDERLPYKNSTDEEFFRILCLIFHPEVRNESGFWNEVLREVNKLINNDGYEFYRCDSISNRPVYGIRKITFLDNGYVYTTGLNAVEMVIDSDHIRLEVQKAIEASNTDSSLAIGQAKELVEATCKYILNDMHEDFEKKDFNALSKQVRGKLGISKNDKNEAIPGVEKILNGLSNIVAGMAELRNNYGSGHGKDPAFKRLPIRYGKLAVSAASSYIEFLLDSYDDFKKKRNQERN